MSKIVSFTICHVSCETAYELGMSAASNGLVPLYILYNKKLTNKNKIHREERAALSSC